MEVPTEFISTIGSVEQLRVERPRRSRTSSIYHDEDETPLLETESEYKAIQKLSSLSEHTGTPLVEETVNEILFGDKTAARVSEGDSQYGFNRALILRTSRLLSIMPKSAFPLAILLIGLHVLLSYSTTILIPDVTARLVANMSIYRTNNVTSDDESRGVIAILLNELLYATSLAALAFGLIIGVGSYFTQLWRESLTKYVHERLFIENRLYSLEYMSNLDNYDQRLADSCRSFTNGFIGAVFGSALFPIGNSVCGNIMTITIGFILLNTGGYELALCLTVFLLIFCLCLLVQLSGVSRKQFQLNKFEGFFRFTHAKVRMFCESIAFYGGELKEKTSALDDYAKVYHTGHKLARALSALQATAHCFISVNNQNNSAISTGAAYFTLWYCR